MTTTEDHRIAYADGLRAAVIGGLQKLTDALRADENVPLPFDGTTSAMSFFPHFPDGETFATAIRAMGVTGIRQQVKHASDVTWLEVTGRIAGLRVLINARADEVCEPVPPQPVIERHCPALDAVIAESQEGGAA